MSDSFQPPIADRPLSPAVEEMRATAAAYRAAAFEALAKPVEQRCSACVELLDSFGELLLVPLETSDLDLEASTRWAALYPLAGRALGFGRALMHLVEAGYGAEAFPVARSIFETTRMIHVFSHPKGTQLAQRWLDGQTPKPSTIRRVLRAIDGDDEASALEQKLYAALSSTGHASRTAMDMFISHSTREVTIGPTSDWGIRAYYVSWAEQVVWEICHAAGSVVAIGMGRGFFEDTILPALDGLKELDQRYPFPSGHERASPIEFMEVE